MNENRNPHHFLNMSRNIHNVISATKVKGTEITKKVLATLNRSMPKSISMLQKARGTATRIY